MKCATGCGRDVTTGPVYLRDGDFLCPPCGEPGALDQVRASARAWLARNNPPPEERARLEHAWGLAA